MKPGQQPIGARPRSNSAPAKVQTPGAAAVPRPAPGRPAPASPRGPVPASPPLRGAASPPLARVPAGRVPGAGQSALERMPKEVKNVIGSHLDKKALASLKATSKTMAATVKTLPAARAATTVKSAAVARMNENKEIRRDWKGMIAQQQATAATHPNRAVRFAAARQTIQDKIEDQKFVGELKKELTPLARVAKKADVQKKKNI